MLLQLVYQHHGTEGSREGSDGALVVMAGVMTVAMTVAMKRMQR